MNIHVAVTLACSATAEELFQHAVVELETLRRGVRARGPLAGVARAEVVDGGELRAGAVRRVFLTDGTVLNEGITEMNAPSVMSYRQLTPYRFPISVFAKGAQGRYTFTPEQAHTKMTWEADIWLTSPLAYPIMVCVRSLFLRPLMISFLECVRDDVSRVHDSDSTHDRDA
jgi:hypothetical protein